MKKITLVLFAGLFVGLNLNVTAQASGLMDMLNKASNAGGNDKYLTRDEAAKTDHKPTTYDNFNIYTDGPDRKGRFLNPGVHPDGSYKYQIVWYYDSMTNTKVLVFDSKELDVPDVLVDVYDISKAKYVATGPREKAPVAAAASASATASASAVAPTKN